MKFLSPIIDRLQATFPPNRVAIALFLILAPAWAWLAKRGIELDPVTTIAVLAGALVLLYKWLDGWQAGESIDVSADLDSAFEEIVAGHQQIDHLLGTAAGVKVAISRLHDRIARGEINEAEIATEIKAIFEALPGTPEAEIGSFADAAPPTAPTPS